jgi:hypothetical protein
VLDVSPHRSDECHDRNPVKEKLMSESAIDSGSTSKPAPESAKSKAARKPKKAKPANKAGRAKKADANRMAIPDDIG